VAGFYLVPSYRCRISANGEVLCKEGYGQGAEGEEHRAESKAHSAKGLVLNRLRVLPQVADSLNEFHENSNHRDAENYQDADFNPFDPGTVLDIKWKNDIDHDQSHGACYIDDALDEMFEPAVIVKDEECLRDDGNVDGNLDIEEAFAEVFCQKSESPRS